MNRKESLCAVIGGCVGAVLTMAICSILPLGAQNQSGSFEEITCTSLVVREDGKKGSVYLWIDEYGGRVNCYGDGSATMGITESGGHVEVWGRHIGQGQSMPRAVMQANETGGEFVARSAAYTSSSIVTKPGFVHIRAGERYCGFTMLQDDVGSASMKITEDGGNIHVRQYGMGSADIRVNPDSRHITVSDKLSREQAFMSFNEHGGRVGVVGKGDSKGQAVMAVNEYGNGGVSTWDKNGYRLATLK